jgi:hypothetical protein
MANTKEVKAANLFTNGFTDTIGDGVAFFASTHPTISDGNQSNVTTAGTLAIATLETAITAVQKIKDDRGILVGASGVSLHIPVDLWNVADTILNTPGKPGGSNNDINATRHMGMIPNGFYVNRRFTGTDDWFIKTDVPNGTKMFARTPLQTKMEPDFDTGNLRFKARERYSFGVSDWRGWFGNAGS